jgi:hypothetical protein
MAKAAILYQTYGPTFNGCIIDESAILAALNCRIII